VFIDSSDVTAQAKQLRLTHPHISTGLGLRYETPVGPLRFDVGYRIPWLQVIGTQTVDACPKNCKEVVIDEQVPSTIDVTLGKTTYQIPIALSLTIGEAF